MTDFVERLNETVESGLKSLADWWEEFTNSKKLPPYWFNECREETPEERARFQEKLDAALKRWEERKAAERAAAESKPTGAK